jgi:integrase
MAKIKSIEITNEQWQSVNPRNRKITDEFLRESMQLSDQTLKQYSSALQIYFYWVKTECEDKDFDKLKSKDFLMFQNYLIRRGLSSSAIRLKRAAVSSLNQYVETYFEDLNFKNYITKKIPAPAMVFVNEKKPPTLEEYEMICAKLEEMQEWQKLAYLRFTFTTGCRRSESVQLLKSIVDSEKKIVEVKTKDENGNPIIKQASFYVTNPIRCKGRGKAGKIRTFQMDEAAMLAIKKWLSVRGNDDCEYVFVSNIKGKIKQLNPATLNKWSKGLFTEILGRRFHPHILREARATSLVVEGGKDIKVVQKLLGHNSPQTSEIYVIRNDEDMSDEAFT